MDTRSLLWGAGAGALVALAALLIARRSLDTQFTSSGRELVEAAIPRLRREVASAVQREVPPAVETKIVETLNRYGITPTLTSRVNRALDLVARTGLLGVR